MKEGLYDAASRNQQDKAATNRAGTTVGTEDSL